MKRAYDRQSGQGVPTAFVTPLQGRGIRAGWTAAVVAILHLCLFGVDISAAGDKRTLQDCIDTALRNHPSIRAANEAVNAADAKVSQSASSYFPQVRASTGYSHNQSTGAIGPTVTKDYTTSLSVNQTLYDFGKTGHALDATRASRRSLEFDQERVVQDVILNVKQSYFALLAADKLATVSQKSLDKAESHYRQAQAFFRAGSKPKYDVTRTEVEVNNARLELINARNNAKIGKITLNNAMGTDPGADISVEDVLSEPTEVSSLERALTEALKSKPELLKADADILAAQERVKAEQSNYLPSLSASGSYNWSSGTSEGNFLGTDIRQDVGNSWNAGIMLSIPLFEGGLTRGRVSEARANLLVLEARRESLRQSILLEVNRAFADLESATARVDVMQTALKKASENLDLAQGRYEAGVGPYIEVTDAQVASLKAETDHVQALYDYQLAAAKLFRAMGRRSDAVGEKKDESAHR
ncbi:MAG: TolC family protein [Nitrospirota bacterium]